VEIWKPIPGYEGLYEVSNLGRVKSLRRNKIMSPGKDRCYRQVNLQDAAGRSYCAKVHRLVALAFHGAPPDPTFTASHLNGIGFDNRPENIVWESLKDNVARQAEHGTRPLREERHNFKLTDEQVRMARLRHRANGESKASIARSLGVCRTLISRVLNGHRRADIA
jgi:hypothetical protein